MSQIMDDDFSKLEYEGWQRVAGQYLDCWANLTKNFIEPLLNATKVSKDMKVLDLPVALVWFLKRSVKGKHGFVPDRQAQWKLSVKSL